MKKNYQNARKLQKKSSESKRKEKIDFNPDPDTDPALLL
jgi:hypothetical protein